MLIMMTLIIMINDNNNTNFYINEDNINNSTK